MGEGFRAGRCREYVLMGCETGTCRVRLSRREPEEDYVALTCAIRQHKIRIWW